MPNPPSSSSSIPNSTNEAELGIRQLVQSANAGQRLPSIRQLRKQFEVGQAVVERVLNQLKDEGVIQVKPKSGSYRSELHKLPINIVYRHSMADLRSRGFYRHFISELILCLSESGWPVRLHAAPEREDLVKVLDQISNTNSRLVTFGMNWVDLELAQNYRRLRSSAVHLLPNFVDVIPASVIYDDKEIVRIQLKHLHELGHRRISYLHRYDDEKWVRAEHVRWSAFHECALHYGFDLDAGMLRFTGLDDAYLDSAIMEMLDAESRPTAIVLSSDHQVESVYRIARSLGLEPGKDLAVVGVNDLDWCEYVDPKLSSVRIDASDAAHAVIKILVQLAGGGDPEMEFIAPKLIVRDSSSKRVMS